FLERNRIPALFFVSSGYLNCQDKPAWEHFCHNNLKLQFAEPNMSWQDARTLAENPLFEIGGHTCNHVSVGALKNREEAWREISLDKEITERALGRPIRYFAYPFGDPESFSGESPQLVAKAGYRMAMTLLPSSNRGNEDPYLLN